MDHKAAKAIILQKLREELPEARTYHSLEHTLDVYATTVSIAEKEGVSGDDELRSTLAAYCRENLAGFKVPRSIDFADELPRTGTGKIQKAKIREPYWEGRDRQI